MSDLTPQAGAILQTGISYIGGTKRVTRALWPADGLTGWRLVARRACAVLCLVASWLASTVFYAFLFGFLILAPVWWIYTMNRRHHIHADRRALAARGGQVTV